MENKILSSLGLCAKAGKLIRGVPMICEALRRSGASKVYLVLEACDTSDNTHKKLNDKCNFYNTEKIRLDENGEALASAVGKSGSIGAVAITDVGLSEMVKRHFEAESTVGKD